MRTQFTLLLTLALLFIVGVCLRRPHSRDVARHPRLADQPWYVGPDPLDTARTDSVRVARMVGLAKSGWVRPVVWYWSERPRQAALTAQLLIILDCFEDLTLQDQTAAAGQVFTALARQWCSEELRALVILRLPALCAQPGTWEIADLADSAMRLQPDSACGLLALSRDILANRSEPGFLSGYMDRLARERALE